MHFECFLIVWKISKLKLIVNYSFDGKPIHFYLCFILAVRLLKNTSYSRLMIR